MFQNFSGRENPPHSCPSRAPTTLKAVALWLMVPAELANGDDSLDMVGELIHRPVVRAVRGEHDVEVFRPRRRQPRQTLVRHRRRSPKVIESVEQDDQCPVAGQPARNLVHRRREVVAEVAVRVHAVRPLHAVHLQVDCFFIGAPCLTIYAVDPNILNVFHLRGTIQVI